MNRRRLALLAGLAALGIGLVETVAPGFVTLPGGSALVTITGVAVLGYGLLLFRSRSRFAYRQADPPDPERRLPVPAPGADFEDAAAQFATARDRFHRADTRHQLRRAAIAVLEQFGNRSEDEAAEMVEDGTWTDDPDASAYLGGDGLPSLSPLESLRRWIGRDGGLARYRRRTVAAIAAVAGVDADPSGEGAATGPVTADSDPGLVERRGTNHWFGASLIAVVCLGIGVVAERPSVVVAGVVGVGFAAYARGGPSGSPEVSLSRSVSDASPDPGESVEVTVEITNHGASVAPDVRVVDGVPPGLAVTEGSPRHGTALRPGESTTFSYGVTAQRGTHEFGTATVLLRGWAGARERERAVRTETELTCVPSLRPTTVPVPLRAQVTPYTGVVDTETGGEGLEFYATREYQPGDARNRVDWNRLARTGELATLEFREERSASVVLAIDVRDAAYVAPDADTDHAVDRSVEAAGRVFARLLADGHRVGVATMGERDCWIDPGTGSDHRYRVERALATDPALSTTPTEPEYSRVWWRTHLRRRLPAESQVVVFSPLCDTVALKTVRELEAGGNRCTVVSPDPTAARSSGQLLARVRRRLNVAILRSTGVPVVDWSADESVDAAMAAHADGGNR